jgi:hypothetical protein
MKNINQLMKEIVSLTANIETNYPELYKYLEETPLFLCKTEEKEICTTDLEGYLQTLKEQLKNHISSHKTKNIL